MEKKLYDLIVNEELLKVAPPLSETEKSILRESILENGCQAPLIVWNGIIVDGHNRYDICKENNIPFAIEEMEFKSLMEAKLWIVKNQLGRRNLTEFQRCELIYPFEKEFKEMAEKRRIALRASGEPTLAHHKRTRDMMAELAGVSHGSWDKAKTIIEYGDESLMDKLRTGEMKIHTAFVQIRKNEMPTTEEKKETEEKADEERKTWRTDKEEKAEEPITYQPITHIDGSLEVPCTRGVQERVPRPFHFVRDQVQFAVENMIREVQIGLNWLCDEDIDKIEQLQEILNDGYDRAKDMIRKMEGTS